MYQTIRNMKVRDERGFTLVELLIVIAIIAILAAIAIPQFAAYRQRAIEAGMTADLKNAATTVEAISVDSRTYAGLTVVSGAGPGPSEALLRVTVGGVDHEGTVRVSAGNTLSVVGTPSSITYSICVRNTGARPGRESVATNERGGLGWADTCATAVTLIP